MLAHWGGYTSRGELCCPWKHVKGIPDKGEFIIFCLIAPPRHPLFKRVVQAVIDRIIGQLENTRRRIHGAYGVLHTTGPIVYTREAVKFMAEEGNEDLVAVHDCIDELGVIHHKAWPKIKWAVPHRKVPSHYALRKNRKVPVVIGD